MLFNAAKCQGYSFYRFWAIKEKPTGRGRGITSPLPPPQIRVKQWEVFIAANFAKMYFTVDFFVR